MQRQDEDRARNLVEHLAGDKQFAGFIIANGTVVLLTFGLPHTDTPTMKRVLCTTLLTWGYWNGATSQAA
jgi:hypothetical protein